MPDTMVPMAATPRKAIALLTTAAGLGILLVAGVVLYRPLEERYWLWKLREGEESEKERAADRLAELGVEEAIPILVSSIPRESHWGVSRRVTKRLSPFWVRALVKRKEAAVPYLQEILKEESVIAQCCAVSILGEIGPPAMEAVPDIVRAAWTVKFGPKQRNERARFLMLAHDAVMQIAPKAAAELRALLRSDVYRQKRA